MNEDIYPYTEIAAFLTWELPTEAERKPLYPNDPSGVLWKWQAGRCAICGHVDPPLCLDHCHVTGLTRGLLCRPCNFAEGGSHHPAFLAWRAGRNPARLLGVEDQYVPSWGELSATDDEEDRAEHYMIMVARFADSQGLTLAKPFIPHRQIASRQRIAQILDRPQRSA